MQDLSLEFGYSSRVISIKIFLLFLGIIFVAALIVMMVIIITIDMDCVPGAVIYSFQFLLEQSCGISFREGASVVESSSDGDSDDGSTGRGRLFHCLKIVEKKNLNIN